MNNTGVTPRFLRKALMANNVKATGHVVSTKVKTNHKMKIKKIQRIRRVLWRIMNQ